jgi:signal transduction histidine kinase
VAQRRRFPVAAALAGVGVAAHVLQAVFSPPGGLTFAWWLALVVVAYGALVGWGQLSQARWALVASLWERARRAEAEQAARVAEARIAERARIAREMHDVLAHRLSLVATYAGALEFRPDLSPEQMARAAGVVRDGVSQALTELREVIGVLRDDADPSGPQPSYADVPRLVDEARAAGQTVRLEDQTTAAPSELVGRTAYRVVQEALSNARRHAPGAAVTILLSGESGDGLTVEVANPYAGGPTGDGLGLTGLRERVSLAGGRLTAGPVGDAFQLRVWLPWTT